MGHGTRTDGTEMEKNIYQHRNKPYKDKKETDRVKKET